MLRSIRGTSIQGAQARKSQKRGERDSPSFDPLAITIGGNQRNGIKRATKNTKRAQIGEKGIWFHGTSIHMSWQKTRTEEIGTRRSIHILLDRWGLKRENKRRWKNGLCILSTNMPWEWVRVERKETNPAVSLST